MIACSDSQMVDVERMYWDEENGTTFTVIESIPLKHYRAWKKATSEEPNA
jgi:hypothetical protein